MSDAVSVIIPTYNRSQLLARALRSALAAVRESDEILVIDDGSTDDTEQVVRSFGQPVRYHRVPNAGPGAARNTGIRLAQNPLLAFLDSDDEYCPDKLLLQRQVMQKYPEVVFSFGNIVTRLLNGELLGDWIARCQVNGNIGAPFPTKHAREILGPAIPFSSVCRLPEGTADFGIHIGNIYRELMSVLYMHSNTVLIRRSLMNAACVYPEDVRLMEDWEFLAALARQGPVAFLDHDVSIMYDHEGVRLASVDKFKQADARIRVLQRSWGADPSATDCDWEHLSTLVRYYRFKRGKLLVSMGRLKEARADFDAAGASLPYRILVRMPTFCVLSLYRTQFWLKKRLGLIPRPADFKA